MNGAEKARLRIDIAAWEGIGIGPLTRPLVRKNEGRVLYIDHATTAELKNKYATQSHVNVNDIVDVDYVWGERTLSE